MKIEAIGWRINPQSGVIELIAKLPSTEEELVVEIPETKFGEIIANIPSLVEEKEIQRLLTLIYGVKEKRVMEISEADKRLKDLEEKQEKVREKMPTVKSKLELAALEAESRVLGTEKSLVDSKRHLIRMLTMEEADLRGKLAKAKSGRGRVS